MATSIAAITARRAATLALLSPSTSRAAVLVPRRGLAGSADPHGPPKVNIWEDPMSPSKWKEEHNLRNRIKDVLCVSRYHQVLSAQLKFGFGSFVIASLTGWFTLFYGAYKAFSGDKKDKSEPIRLLLNLATIHLTRTPTTKFVLCRFSLGFDVMIFAKSKLSFNLFERAGWWSLLGWANLEGNFLAARFPSPRFGSNLGLKMLKQMLACCKVYVSESRNKAALEAIEMAAKLIPEAPIINKFEDATYNRVGYTLVSQIGQGPDSSPLKNAVFEMVKAAFEAIDLGLHCGSHPRLGVVDHICFHPLNGSSLDCVAGTAKSLAADVGAGLQGLVEFGEDEPLLKLIIFLGRERLDIEGGPAVATFLYGAAHAEGRSLDTIRRELGYFKPNADGNQWVGSLRSEALQLKPDDGPPRAVMRKGVVVIGATEWVDNYNVPIFSTEMAAVRRIAKRVSGRGGGFPSVQSMALAHGKGMIEVACNLLETSKADGEDVQQAVERLGREEGMEVGEGYYTDLSQRKIIEGYFKLAELASK
ncbi:hypothetical protein SASPL_152153 [Salvia splendens]|uniref:Formiminotransferase N-terminal subdomain domain-containing protein n=1 Tax=Salvia splendens TaxID=180675 RepID=A0A8X8W3B6_SALSN|nr:hypothetical protein SASPL_152153 [Salvia splendens]